MQGSERAPMTHDTFGRELPEPSAIYDPESSCWRMFGGMFPSDSMPSLATLPAWGMTRGGALFELPTQEPPTGGHASSSLLPTPVSDNSRGLPSASTDYQSLPNVAVSLLPTPTSSVSSDGITTERAQDRARDSARGNLVESVLLLPTPRASDGTKGGPNQRGSKGDLMLPSAVMLLLPTPAVNDMGAGKTPEQWDEWTAKMRAKHGNGNGHGPSLSIEAQRIGASTPQPSTDGDTPSDDPHQHPPNPAATDDHDSIPDSWNG
jgi:hypothetical protein